MDIMSLTRIPLGRKAGRPSAASWSSLGVGVLACVLLFLPVNAVSVETFLLMNSDPGDPGGIDADLVSLGSISGRVTAAGAPVEGEYVRIQASDLEWYGGGTIVFTDADGNYTARGLTAGSYKVSFTSNWRKAGLDEWFHGKSSFAFADQVTVAPQSDTGGIDADLQLPGRIVGRVTYRGWPAPGVWVSVYLLGGDRLGFFILEQALTDADGRYVLGGLDSGLYLVQFGGNQWYSYKPDAASADIIALTAPGEVIADGELAPLSSISGTVTSGGLPLDATTMVQVSVQDLAGKVLADWNTSGSYQIPGLPPGRYKVRFSSYGYAEQWYSNKASREQADIVEILGTGDITGINADMKREARISGTVTSGGVPLANVPVEVYDIDHNLVSTAFSSYLDGTFVAPRLPGGSYKVRFSGGAVGHENAWYAGKTSFETADAIVLPEYGEATGINADLPLGGGISGTVTCAGVPTKDITVLAQVPDGSQFGEFGSAVTNINGSYLIQGLPSGSYVVWFSRYNCQMEVYNDKPRFDLADLVVVAAPGVTAGIDADLVHTGGISGKVTADGVPLQGVWVGAYPADDSFNWPPGATTAADGTYVIPYLASGSYKVKFSAFSSGCIDEWYNAQATFEDAQVVTVASPDATTGIDADLVRPGSIKGRVTSGGLPVQGVYVSAYNLGGTVVSSATSVADGTYEIGFLRSGSYKVEFSAGAFSLESEWYNDMTSLESAGIVVVVAPGTAAGIDADLAQSGSISGTVTARGAPAASAQVTLWDLGGNTLTWTPAGADGAYTLSRVSRGSYRVGFWKSGLQDGWYQGKASYEQADIVTVGSGEAVLGIDGQLADGGSVAGRATHAGVPVAGLQVEIRKPSQTGWSATLATDGDGRYLFPNLPSGDYTIHFLGTALTLVDRWHNGRMASDLADLIHVTAPEAVAGIDVALTRGGSICGRAEGDLVVSVLTLAGDPVASALAESGEYCVPGVPSGTYKVKGSGPGGVVWYNNRGSLGTAEEVAVLAPYPTVGIDLVAGGSSNAPPILDPVGDKLVEARTQIRFLTSGSDPDNDHLVFSALSLPAGASFDAATKTFTWIPNDAQMGFYRITFRVADDGSPSLADVETITIHVWFDNWPCVNQRWISVNAPHSYRNNGQGSTDLFDYYACSDWDESGPEYTYSFTAPQTGYYAARLTDLNADLDVFVLGAAVLCDGGSCVGGGDNNASWLAVAGQEYFIVVDGYEGAVGEYTLTVVSNDECLAQRSISVNAPHSYRNDGQGSTDVVDYYYCSGWDESGPEYTYSFTAPQTGYYAASLTNLSADLDVFVLDAPGACAGGSCLGLGDSSASWLAVAGQEYYIVVDGYEGAVGEYTLTVERYAYAFPFPWVGSVSITSDKNVVAVGRPHVGSEVASYDSFPAGALSAYLPMLFKNAFGGSYNSAFYIQNVEDTSTANIVINYYDSSGNLNCTVNDSVAPLASKGYWVPSQPCPPAGWVGGVIVTSDQPIVAIGRPHIGAEVMTYDGFSSGSLTSYLPMLFKDAFGGSYDSAFYVQNVDAANTANLTIDFYDNVGNLSCRKIGAVAPLASKGYWLPAESCLPTGWVGGAVITSDQPIVTVGRPHVGAQITTYNGFSSGAAASYVPMLFKGAFGGSYNAAFYVQNVNAATAANLAIKYYDVAGNLNCSVNETVAAWASKGYWVPNQTCLPAGWVGGVVVTSDQPIVAVGRPHIGDQVTAYNGFTSGSRSSYLPMLFSAAFDGSYNSAFYIQNTEASMAAVTIRFFDSSGALTYTRDTTIPALSTLGLWLPSLMSDQ